MRLEQHFLNWFVRVQRGLSRRIICKVRELWDRIRGAKKNVISQLALARVLGSQTGQCDVPTSVLERYVAHKFDILGSGWTRIYYGMSCDGFHGICYSTNKLISTDKDGVWLKSHINRSNVPQAQIVWRLLDEKYQPIDWQRDIKSGYRWKVKTWYRFIPHGHLPGVDIKVPWELSVMHHLVQMALAYGDSSHELYQDERLSRDFRNQLLDFVATNPVRFGVNWSCTMLVAMRVANWLLAYDLFRAAGVNFDKQFEGVFISSIHDHGQHIRRNLEWHQTERANHYLANIMGLIFIAVYLDESHESDEWLGLSIKELIKEVDFQFYHDGCNFEGSTCYHRLSTEFVIFSTAIIVGLKKERINRALTGYGPLIDNPNYSNINDSINSGYSLFPPWYCDRLAGAVAFLEEIKKPDGNIPQVGDNDSGRLFKLSPSYECISVTKAINRFENLSSFKCALGEDDYWVENHLDPSGTIKAGNALLGNEPYGVKSTVEANIIQGLTRGKALPRQLVKNISHCGRNLVITSFQKLLVEYGLPLVPTRIREFHAERGNLLNKLTLQSYQKFGCYLYKSDVLYLLVRCIAGNKPVQTAHLHNDQLAVELVLNDKSVIVDPGSYIYTAAPEERNLYRSVHAHDTPWSGMMPEPVSMKLIFGLPNFEVVKFVEANKKCFAAIYQAAGQTVAREILITEKSLFMRDWGRGEKESRQVILQGYGYGIRG